MFSFKTAGLSLMAISALSVANLAQADVTPEQLVSRNVRTCHFGDKGDDNQCWAKIIKCPVTEAPLGGGCMPYLTIRCEKGDGFSGGYTEVSTDRVVRVTAGDEPMPGAPVILHAQPESVPGTVEALLAMGTARLKGSCDVRNIE